ncbi:hypothetical protein AKJ58_01535, partial [candidate division MSBL1 archaeon SCGC-AAA385D11]
EKKPDHLVKSFKKVSEENPEAKLYLVGGRGGKNEKRIRKLVKELNLSKNVEIIERVSRKEVVKWMNKCQVFAHPMPTGSFGMVTLEAMACGIPVVATKTPYSPTFLGDSGLYVEPNDEEEFAEAILTLLEDEKLRKKLVKRGKERIQKFDYSSWGRKMHRIIRNSRNENLPKKRSDPDWIFYN